MRMEWTSANMGFWAPIGPPLQNLVDATLSKCEICIKNNIRKGVTTPIGQIPIPKGPFTHITMDYVDMIKPIHGKWYMLVIEDRFSRWVEAVTAKHQNGDTIIKFLCTEVIPRFGIPSMISSDNGKAFVDKVVMGIYQKLGIRKRLGCVYHPQSQEMVEQVNVTLKAKLNKIRTMTKLN